MKKALVFALALLLIFLPLIHLPASSDAAGGRLILASTTSTQNSGLLDYLSPLLRSATGIEVHVVAVGTGAALEMGRRGDADVVLVHAKELELELLRKGFFVNRRDVMYNDFVIIGPKNDPAGIKNAKSAAEAFRKIESARGTFVSRGDNSGTHKREQSLWKEAGISPSGSRWYLEVGQGQAKAQRIANEKQAYTLTDRGTWLSKMDSLDLEVLFAGMPELFNQYGVMAVNPQRRKHVNFDAAMGFIKWLTSPEGQEAIDNYRTPQGDKLFTPNYNPNNKEAHGNTG